MTGDVHPLRIFMVLAIHLGDLPLVCKTEILIIADHNVLMNGNSHRLAGKKQLAGN